MRAFATLLIAFFALALAPAQARAADASQFAVGQEWTVKNSPIHVVIGRIERVGVLNVVSVSLLRIPCPAGFGCQTIGAAHMPFDAAALAGSVDAVVATGVSPLVNSLV